jgi:phosphoglycolate phosphatase
MRIPLFDIDWTLIQGGNKPHGDGFAYALYTFYHIPKEKTYEEALHSHGKIDNQIIIETATRNGIAEKTVLQDLPEIIRVIREYFFAHQDEGDYIALPGVKETLSLLQRQQIPIGMLTGNIAEIGWRKVECAGLKEFIQFGAFGNMAFKRVNLIPIAYKEAVEKLGVTEAINQCVIIGDSPLDVACAKQGNIASVAVASGKYTKDELAKTEPDLLLSSLEETEKLLEFVTSS